jgi:hypothetical protein
MGLDVFHLRISQILRSKPQQLAAGLSHFALTVPLTSFEESSENLGFVVTAMARMSSSWQVKMNNLVILSAEPDG